MGSKERFMQSLGWWSDFKIEWFDFTGYHKINDDLIARIALSYSNVVGKYDQIVVRIINKKSGETVDAKRFSFKDYLRPAIDQPHPSAKYHQGLYVYTDLVTAWHVLVPEDTRQIASPIMDYINLWSEK